ncbi:hypothetical protein BOX15_Mlig007531g1 [Macrostomum lignano]|uniref:WH1 domain-containing protein n=1 Tax=Macrostomum lignano TaxID=282301 RepID=A0A267FDC4_9PLAT|nr:hypothetical protein BOX15_Mlig007531g1 [Macrostomum lignano]
MESTAAAAGPESQELLSFNDVMERNSAEQLELADRSKLSSDDIEKLRITFSSQAATCYVCPCLVSLYLKVVTEHQMHQPHHQQYTTWKSVFGPSALILLMPNFEPTEKFVQSELILAHLGTCFPLWSLRVYSVTSYVAMSMHFQTVSDETYGNGAVHGLAFTDQDAATEFSTRLNNRLRDMAEFESASSKERRRTVKDRERRSKSLRRMISRSKSSSSSGFAEISRPCICQRLASATDQDCQAFSAMAFNANRTEQGGSSLASTGDASGAVSPAGTMEADGTTASGAAITC